jgi:methyl-accepting chemotaxis protein
MTLIKTIQGKLVGTVLMLACVAAAIGLFELSKLSESNQRIHVLVTQTAPRIMYTDDAEIALLNYLRYQKNVILATNESERQASINEQKAYLDQFHVAIEHWEAVASEQGKKDLLTVRADVEKYERLNNQVIGLASAGKTREAQALSFGEGRSLIGEVSNYLETSMDRAAKAMEAQAKESEVIYASTRLSIWLVMVIGIGLSFGVAWFVTRQTVSRIHRLRDHLKDVAEGESDLTKRIPISNEDEIGEVGEWLNRFLAKLQQMICEVVANTNNIAAASQELAANATQISKSASVQREEAVNVATAMQEMSATVIEVSNNSSQAVETARQAEAMARSGGETVRRTVDTIRTLAEDTRESARRIQELGKSSDQIGKIIGVIDDIADQTNLLALNAAIEAARAGEQGRGFAVVADEVRKLAERTSGATKEITTMVTTIQGETKKAVDAMNNSSSQVEVGVKDALEAGAALEKIIEGASGAQVIITQIATAAHEQSSATDQVTQNMDQIAKMIDQSAAGAEESARAIESLSSQATQLQSLISQFKVDENQGRSSGAHEFHPTMREFSRNASQLYQ